MSNTEAGNNGRWPAPAAEPTVSWMRRLAQRYQAERRDHPNEPLLLACDIDGTIIDMRHLVLSVLQSYDRAHGTAYFVRLILSDITVHENRVEQLFDRVKVPEAEQGKILDWYLERRWQENTLVNAHRAYRGAFAMIRWFQLQPHTNVALVTGRPEVLRDITLRSLNTLGEPHRVHFSDELLLMNPGGWEDQVPEAKLEALDRLRSQGHHVFAMIDNEPAVLDAMSQPEVRSDLLLLHANTIYESQAAYRIPTVVSGDNYELAELVPNEEALPKQVQLVWHGVNDKANLGQFVASEVKWAEVDVRQDPAGALILRHDSFETTPTATDDDWLTLENALTVIKQHNRGVKLDLKVGGEVLDRVLDLVQHFGFNGNDLWFNGNIEIICETGFRRIVDQYPAAITQCPIDWLTPLLWTASDEAKRILELLTEWGVTRFSISWERKELRKLLAQLDAWGHEVNIYDIPDLEAFLEAVVLLPCSVTSDFNFPRWHRFGRGSGKAGRRFTYSVDTDGAH